MTENYENRIKTAKELIEKADFVLIGAGAGLSTAAGFEYGGAFFQENFKDFADKYGMTDMYSAGFYPFKTSEEKWAYWSRMIYHNRYKTKSNKTYESLLQIVKDKNYFVITTNVDHQFQLAGFDKSRLFYTQGDYGLFQCSEPCHNKTYDNEQMVMQMIAQQHDCRIPTELIPRCPVCHKEMSTNLRSDDTFVQDEGWNEHCNAYVHFVDKMKGTVVLIEIGVGYNTPGIIKYPFERLVYQNRNYHLIRINKDYPEVYDEIKKKSVSFDEDVNKIFADLLAK